MPFLCLKMIPKITDPRALTERVLLAARSGDNAPEPIKAEGENWTIVQNLLDATLAAFSKKICSIAMTELTILI